MKQTTRFIGAVLAIILLMSTGAIVRTRIVNQTDTQVVRLDNSYVAVDDSSFANGKRQKVKDIAPLIQHFASIGGPLNKSITEMGIYDGAGNNFRTTLRNINPDIDDLSEIPGFLGGLSGNNLFSINAIGTDYKTSISILNTFLTSTQTWNDSVNVNIEKKVTPTYILDSIQSDTNFQIVNGQTNYGFIYLTKTGNSVTGIWDHNAVTGTGELEAIGVLGSYAPTANINIVNQSRVDGNPTHLFLFSDGSIKFEINNNDNTGIAIGYTIQ